MHFVCVCSRRSEPAETDPQHTVIEATYKEEFEELKKNTDSSAVQDDPMKVDDSEFAADEDRTIREEEEEERCQKLQEAKEKERQL